ncbi:hypothetical protein HOLleu_02505 [Holothuria leucospilota]|uniref:Uncharacterized protein n=1 Tax=Holothuria leucospilota TaxID=206669 RepID=A0A9Q1HH32_HOLLE|nr:hypothetical protein HOLleu_02505 [Holothuria leucospilota]
MSLTVPIGSIHAATLHNSRLAPHPCSYSISGTWANTTVAYFTPNPPKSDRPTNVYLNFTAVDDLWFGNIRGNVTRMEDKWVYSFDTSLCGSNGICPIRKGENRVYNETLPSPSTFIRPVSLPEKCLL